MTTAGSQSMTYFSALVTLAMLMLLTSGIASAQDGESSVYQMPSESPSQAFVEQLPETAVVPVPDTPPAASKTVKPRPKPQLAQRKPINSIFPNVGTGVNARVDAGATAVQLPTVGGGVTQSL